jgi:hypothetical protein
VEICSSANFYRRVIDPLLTFVEARANASGLSLKREKKKKRKKEENNARALFIP